VYNTGSSRNRHELVISLHCQVDDFHKQFSNQAIAEDFNLTNKKWISHVLDLKQVVGVPSHGSVSILDLILTNIEMLCPTISYHFLGWSRRLSL